MKTITLPKTEYEELLKSKERLEEILKDATIISSRKNQKFDDSAFGIFKKKQTRGQIYETRFRKLVDKELDKELAKLGW
jgi:hypothetical protein